MKEIAVFGLGRLGRSFAITYSNLGGKVIAVDKIQEKVDEIADYVTIALRADVTEESVIKSLGVSSVDMAVVTMGDSLEASIIVTAVCKEMGIPYIIAKAKDTMQGKILQKVGADEIIYPETETGERMARNIAHSGRFVDIAEISDDYSIIEGKVPSGWVGKNLVELSLRTKHGFNVIAVKSENQLQMNPDARKPLERGMQVVVLGNKKQLEKVFK